jgi:hypothetical protein
MLDVAAESFHEENVIEIFHSKKQFRKRCYGIYSHFNEGTIALAN